MIGKTILHYKITEKLGQGGMGVVYKAEDTKLRRDVAIKFLPRQIVASDEERQRFKIEAQAAAALNHPNIATIYAIEKHDEELFIVMEYINGKELRDFVGAYSDTPLPVDQTIHYATQIAEGLQAAHEKGVVHRDIKPANILITEKGQVRITDFGLAKLAGRTQLTKEGTSMGTVAYMSPEQAQGIKIDQRTDIWALGAVIYEMITGKQPFAGDYEQAVMYSIMNEDPEPPTALRTGLPLELERIVLKALAKNPDERYQRIEEMLVDLKGVRKTVASSFSRTKARTEEPFKSSSEKMSRTRPTSKTARPALLIAIPVLLLAAGLAVYHFLGKAESHTPAIRSIAVLPLANLSNDPDQEYFVQGMHEMLITDLSKIGALKVISRTSVMRYKNSDESMAQIAKALDVDALIEGSVLRVGNQVRIAAQLIRGSTDEHLWAESYDRDLQNVIPMLSKVAQAIASEIKVVLTKQEKERLSITGPVNAKAQEAYLKARYHYNKWTKEGFEKAIEYFQEAIEIDPGNAQAYTGLAGAYLWLWYLGDLPREETYTKVKAFLKKAFEIDNKLAEGHLLQAMVRFYYEWNWLGGEAEYKQAIDLNPGFVEAHIEYTWALIAMGRVTEAMAEANRSLQLDPLSVPANVTLGFVYYFARQYNQAIAQWRKTTELEPNDSRAYSDLATIYEQIGRYDDAVKARQKEMSLSGAKPEEIAALGRIYDQSGYQGYLMWRLERLKPTDAPYSTASIYVRLGDKDQALTLLETAYKEHDGSLFLLKVQPRWDPLRSDPRFRDLLRRMNFPE